MKKEILKQNLNKIEKTLIEYFNNVKCGRKPNSDYHYYGLKILDSDTRTTIPGYTRYLNVGYTGVTVNYLRKYLFNNIYSKSMIYYCLINLLKYKEVRTLNCMDIRNIVFENKKNTNHATYHYKDLSHKEKMNINSSYRKYKQYINSYNSINSYLNNNKLENSNS